jgi:hypothetical protein
MDPLTSEWDPREPSAYTAGGRLWVAAGGDSQHPLHEFFKHVEEAKNDIRAFHKGVQLYEVKMMDPIKYPGSQVSYGLLQVTMTSISDDMRRLRNYAWRLGDKFNGQILLRHANTVLSMFQTTCALLHSVEARSRQTQQNAGAGVSPYPKMLTPIEEVEEPEYSQSKYRHESAVGTCFRLEDQHRRSALEIDTRHTNMTEKPFSHGAKHDEALAGGLATVVDFDFGGPFSNSRVWRQRQLVYISVSTALVVLVTVVSVIGGYAAAGIRPP